MNGFRETLSSNLGVPMIVSFNSQDKRFILDQKTASYINKNNLFWRLFNEDVLDRLNNISSQPTINFLKSIANLSVRAKPPEIIAFWKPSIGDYFREGLGTCDDFFNNSKNDRSLLKTIWNFLTRETNDDQHSKNTSYKEFIKNFYKIITNTHDSEMEQKAKDYFLTDRKSKDRGTANLVDDSLMFLQEGSKESPDPLFMITLNTSLLAYAKTMNAY